MERQRGRGNNDAGIQRGGVEEVLIQRRMRYAAAKAVLLIISATCFPYSAFALPPHSILWVVQWLCWCSREQYHTALHAVHRFVAFSAQEGSPHRRVALVLARFTPVSSLTTTDSAASVFSSPALSPALSASAAASASSRARLSVKLGSIARA